MKHNVGAPRREIMIDSNWIMTVGMGLLFVICGAFLFWNIRNLLLDRIDHSLSVTYAVSAFSCFLLAYSFPAKSLKVAFLLLGADVVFRVALGQLHASTVVQHSAAIVGSVARQIAYVLILLAIALWFKSVIRRNLPSNPGVSDS
jgi:hypothetical protein